MLAIATFDVALTGHYVLRLLLLRQTLFMGTAIAMALRDIVLGPSVTFLAVGTGLVPVVLLATALISAAQARASAYRKRLRREDQLADDRDAAEQASAKKSSFIATISHELRTQLNGVVGMAQNLLKTELTPDQQHQVEIISESGRSLNTLLDSVLDLSKLEAGKLTTLRSSWARLLFLKAWNSISNSARKFLHD
jgi:signal transduction histidine kinase